MCSSHRRKVAWDSSLDYTHVDERRLPAASRAASLETQLSQYLYPFLDRSGSGNSKGGDVGHSAAAGARKSGSLKMKKKVKQATPDATELPRPSDRPSPNFDHHREECPPQTGSPANHDNETNEDDNMQPTRPEACEASTVSHFRKSSITSQLQYGTCGGDDDLQHCAQLLLERCNGSSTRPPLGFSYKCVDTGRYMPHLMVGSLPPSRGSRASRKGKHYTALVSASHNRISISPGSRASERTGTTSSGLKKPRNAGQPEPATEKLTPISPSQGLEEEDTAVPHSAAGQSSGSSDTTSTNTLYVCEAEEGALDTKQTLPSGPPDVKAEEPATPTEAERSGTTCESGMADAKSGAREEPVIRETGERAGDPHEETSEKTEEKVDEEKDPNEELSEAEESGEECVTDGEITESAPEEVATGG
ncbi:unnamed protein product [Trypanosoma congolense IL3000]|uniref:WGS project CAEQ00000000 data, annotated contig 1562 n=1 Tax=Trypanosoma congolense (strain IL3000) TaxID=1068625 RepID=F9W741_TRYCI|nr:unnamed protein product [Trypanosoma congolense IL3000]